MSTLADISPPLSPSTPTSASATPRAPASEARRIANRRNAQKSTGPRTAEGKAKSSRNALKHGLTGEGVVLPPDLAEARDQRLARWTAELRPATEIDRLLVDRAVLASVRLDACRRREVAQLRERADRARGCWDVDRNIEVEALAAGLARRPSRVAAELKGTWHGVAWLRARWEGLAASLDHAGTWSDAEQALAMDLLGIPPSERAADPLGLAAADSEALRALVVEEDARLADLQEELALLNESERERAITGESFDLSAPARALRSYEAACERILHRSLSELFRRRGRETGARPLPRPADPEPSPSWAKWLTPRDEPETDAIDAIDPPEPEQPPTGETEHNPDALTDFQARLAEAVARTVAADRRELERRYGLENGAITAEATAQTPPASGRRPKAPDLRKRRKQQRDARRRQRGR